MRVAKACRRRWCASPRVPPLRRRCEAFGGSGFDACSSARRCAECRPSRSRAEAVGGRGRTVFVRCAGSPTKRTRSEVAMSADALASCLPPARQVAAETVRDITKRLPHGIVTVGCSGRASDIRFETVLAPVCTAPPAPRARAVQRGGQCPFPPAVRDPGVSGGRRHASARGKSTADVVLVDSPTPGSGTVFDWSTRRGTPTAVRLLLAGGLDAGNVAAAVANVRPWGVGRNPPGLESAPGRKDPPSPLFIEAPSAPSVTSWSRGLGAGRRPAVQRGGRRMTAVQRGQAMSSDPLSRAHRTRVASASSVARFVPETLVATLVHSRPSSRPDGRPTSPRRVRRGCSGHMRPTTPVTECTGCPTVSRANPAEARRPHPYRFAQDQHVLGQASYPADGQAGVIAETRGPARRGDGDGSARCSGSTASCFMGRSIVERQP